MKKALIVLLALALPATVRAMDINQGKLELSGQTALNFSDMTTEVSGEPDIDTTTFSLQVDGAYYVRTNLGVGLIFQYEKTEVEQAGVETDTSFFLFGPQVTYNIPLNEKVSLFVNGALGYATAEVDNVDADGFGFQLGGGLKYFLTNSVSVNGAIHYQIVNLEDDFGRDIDTSGVNLGVGLSLYF